jgi:predicted nucleic acid-binding protein
VSRVLLDTGPLVALLNRRDAFHAWARRVMGTLPPPLMSCDAVVSEACFLLRRTSGGADAVLELVDRGLLVLDFRLSAEHDAVRRLMRRYASVPMSVADACLVRMAELDASATVLTLDADFRVYRKHGRHMVPTLLPP